MGTSTLNLAPRFTITDERLQGCTPMTVRILALFSYGRCVSINKRLGHLIVSTRRFWIRNKIRVINFDRISHITYRAQSVPALPWRYLVSGSSDSSGWSFFLIGLALRDEQDEVPLFTVWQALPRAPDWLDKLAGHDELDQGVGDEAAREFVDALKKLTGASLVRKH